jgi:hypothetical protein
MTRVAQTVTVAGWRMNAEKRSATADGVSLEMARVPNCSVPRFHSRICRSRKIRARGM